MGANRNDIDFKALFEKLVTDLHLKFDEITDRFTTIYDCLMNIEQHGQTNDTTSAAAHAQHNHEATAAKLEAEAKKSMEEAGRAFLKQQKESSTSSTILGIVDDLEGKLFDNFNKSEPPRQIYHRHTRELHRATFLY